MLGLVEFIAAFAVFFVGHSVPVRPRIRAHVVSMLGSRGFTLAYSALSLVVLAWLIGAAGRAPFVPLWTWAPWQNGVTLAAMAVVCGLLALALGRPNPFSFGGVSDDAFDPRRPGVVRLTRHPLLLALAIWAFAHIVPNGDLAHVILFGAFGLFALFGQRIIDRRKRAQMGPLWDSLRSEIGRTRVFDSIAGTPSLMVRIVVAVILYSGLVLLHPLLFGVSPLS